MRQEKTREQPLDRTKVKFCREPSKQFLKLLDEWDGDPRSALGARALKESAKKDGGFVPTWDERNAE